MMPHQTPTRRGQLSFGFAPVFTVRDYVRTKLHGFLARQRLRASRRDRRNAWRSMKRGL
jgi:hypothetical protein